MGREACGMGPGWYRGGKSGKLTAATGESGAIDKGTGDENGMLRSDRCCRRPVCGRIGAQQCGNQRNGCTSPEGSSRFEPVPPFAINFPVEPIEFTLDRFDTLPYLHVRADDDSKN